MHQIVTVLALLSALASFAGPHRASALGVTAHAAGTVAASTAPGGSFRKPSDTVPPHP